MTAMGDRINELREQKGYKQAELAKKVGISGPSLSEIENGHTKALKDHTLFGLCRHLSTTADYILYGDSAQAGIALAAMEAELLFTIRSISPEKRVALMEYARFLRGEARTQPQEQETGKSASVQPLRPKKKR